jgi:CMP-N-acetylneuraminic acid synthetase
MDIAKVKVLSLIPARSGSRTLRDKNIRLLAGKPLLAYSIEQSLSSKLIDRTIVSTDSKRYADLACEYGAEVPFLRPPEISKGSSTDLEAFTHALDWLRREEGYIPDICVHLRPTYPVRKVEDIDNIIRMLLDNPDLDSVRSVVPAPFTPMKMWFRSEEGLLSPAVKSEIKEAYNLPRQLLPPAFAQNACIDALRTRVITEMKSMTGSRIFGYVMEGKSYDIDTEKQLQEAGEYLAKKGKGKAGGVDSVPVFENKKVFCFDIDGIMAKIVPNNRYELAEQLPDNIRAINFLYEQGHQILLFTARGSATGIDWTEVTRKQLDRWGVKYHKLFFGKPAADYYVDDKLITMEQIKTFISKSHASSSKERS